MAHVPGNEPDVGNHAEPLTPTTRWRQQRPVGLVVLPILAVVAAALYGVLTAGGIGSDSYSVGDLLRAREAGTVGRESVKVTGYWSARLIPHSCTPPEVPYAFYNAFCHDREYGLTEVAEPISMLSNGQLIEARSPHLTPWISPDHPDFAKLFPRLDGTHVFAPALVVLSGHFDDELSAECPKELQEACRDRFVIDDVLESQIGKVAADPTPPQLTAEGDLLSPGECAGDVQYSFEGWTTVEDLGLDFGGPGKVYAMVTVDPMLLGGEAWNDPDPGGEHHWRPWGRRICFAKAGEIGVVYFGSVPGTDYVEWDDGVQTIGQERTR